MQFKIFRRYPHLSTQCSPVWVPPVSSTSSRLGLGSVQMLDQPLWFPSAQKKMKDQGKSVVPLWHVASLYSVFCDGLLSNLTTFWWVPGKLAYDKFYIEKREIATKKHGVKLVHTSEKILILIFLKVHTKFQIICYLKSYTGIIFFWFQIKCAIEKKLGNMKYWVKIIMTSLENILMINIEAVRTKPWDWDWEVNKIWTIPLRSSMKSPRSKPRHTGAFCGFCSIQCA